MGIIRQTIICIIIGLIFMSCEYLDNKTIDKFADRVGEVILRDYTISDIKVTCTNTIKDIKDIKEKTKNAIEYTEETMAEYRKNVI